MGTDIEDVHESPIWDLVIELHSITLYTYIVIHSNIFLHTLSLLLAVEWDNNILNMKAEETLGADAELNGRLVPR